MEQQILTTYSKNDIFKIVSEAVETTVSKLLRTQPTDPTLLTRQQTAQILSISLPTLDDYTRHGIIPASRIGTRIRYKKADIYTALKEISTIKYRRAK